ncbi:2-polyprenyl-6-methoxyphenol hydroxylase-like FAD-dependent oxidoreductase [Murinocardiopsis flavida]|uniref:2-polyprenyl-6-methoxyphenol hydroxylase-like FAD-dependent oxidoreductase n=1 Tax=Murinocardiopsis flavida TaxID=645275 RepID=A0A2P8DMA8_9ACTN|nr:FAD-dependent monooxygenase [Murinocardiopsis flavida]PSK98348.1 2-polyprenyl-6-methoxyphenol hydroxylase-like FAD-dependent oxidoreductase [Murinocardiopsis flavida]
MSSRPPTVLVSGASIAGPALAYWLGRHGYAVTVVERSPALRPGGYAIDVRGAALDVAQRMGVREQIREQRTRQQGMTVVHGRRDRRIDITGPTFDQAPAASPGIEIMRDDLCATLYQAAADNTEYLFDDTITAIDQGPDGAKVTFENAAPRTFDIVVGADGLHSATRSLAFGPEHRYRRDLGAYVAIFTTDNYRGLDHWAEIRNTPGRLMGMYAARGNTTAMGLFLFRAEESLGHDHRDEDQQKRILEAVFAGAGWEAPELLRRMRTAEDFYFDTVSQIRMDRWTAGRVALVGDAGYGPSPMSGQGTSLAIVGAYVLAGELKAAGGDHTAAFPRYEARMRGFVRANQDIAGDGLKVLAPRTPAGVWLRNQAFRAAPIAARFGGLIDKVHSAANAIDLPAY